MKPEDRMQRFVRLAVMLAVPTLACFGYYTLEALPAARSAWAVPAVLAYPMALVGAIGSLAALRAAQKSALRTTLWALCLLVPLAFLVWLRR
jgi:uncharacterized membrane protein YsdA (DUF1294 family)